MDLSYLPVYESYPFDGKTDVPIVERAEIQFKKSPHLAIPYNLERLEFVVGRSPDSSIIYYTSQAMRRKDGSLFAVHGDVAGSFETERMEEYKVFNAFMGRV